MRKLPLTESLRVIGRGSLNWMAERPICVSFEVTDSCTCYCKHCDHGGPKDNSKNLKPEDYDHYMNVLRPPVVQISGGEPLMRKDLLDIVKSVKRSTGMPYLILVSNWSLMTEDKYLALREAGVSVGFIYRYFAGQTDIFLELFEAGAAEIHERISAVVDAEAFERRGAEVL